MSLRRFQKKPQKKAIIEDEDEAADFRKARPSRRGSAAKNPSALSSKKKRNILDDSDSEEDAPKPKKSKEAPPTYGTNLHKRITPNSASSKSKTTPTSKVSTSTPTSKGKPATPASKRGVSTPTSKRGVSTPTSSKSKSNQQPCVTLHDFFGTKPIHRINRTRPVVELRHKEVESVPESPRESMEMAAMFDEMVKDIPAGDLDAHGSKEDSAHQDDNFSKTLQDEDSRCSTTSSQMSLKRPKVVLERVCGGLSSSVSRVSDSPPLSLPHDQPSVGGVVSLASATPTKRSLRDSTLRQSGSATPQKMGTAITPKKSATPRKVFTPQKSGVIPKKGTPKKSKTPLKKAAAAAPQTPDKPLEKPVLSDKDMASQKTKRNLSLRKKGEIEYIDVSPQKSVTSDDVAAANDTATVKPSSIEPSSTSPVKQLGPKISATSKKITSSIEPSSSASPVKQLGPKISATSKKLTSSVESSSSTSPIKQLGPKISATSKKLTSSVEPSSSTSPVKQLGPKISATSKKFTSTRKKAIKYIDDDDEEEGKEKTSSEKVDLVKAVIVSPAKAVSPVKSTIPEKLDISSLKDARLSEFSRENVCISPSTKMNQSVSVRSARSVTPKTTPTTTKTTPTGVHKPAKALSLPPLTPEERKAQRTDSFIRYMNRSGPRNPGSKEIPQGAERCLEGLVFVVTGVLESLEREEASEIIKNYGGRVTGSVSGKTSHLVAGEEAGESKLAKARQHGTKVIDEDGLLDLIRTRPGPAGRGNPQAGKEKHPAKTKTTAKKRPGPEFSSSSSGLPPKIPKLESSSATDPAVPADHTSQTGNVIDGGVTGSCSGVTGSCGGVTRSSGATEGGAMEDMVKSKISRSGSLLWVDKYRPTSTKQLVGQKGEASSNAVKLARWLRNWHKNCANPKSKDLGAKFKAVLLAGPPGVGKTTTAQLVCKEGGYSYVERNASSCRNKSSLQTDVAGQLTSASITSFLVKEGGVASTPKNHALIMDEVDGMDGNADRGGISELISLIKSSHIPVICICNEHQSSKMRSLVKHCYLLPFSHPKVEQIRGAVMSICFKEHIKIDPHTLREMIVASGQDMRQVLHNLSLWSASDDPATGVKEGIAKGMMTQKLKIQSPFAVVKKVFEPYKEDEKELSLQEKSELFFMDYSMSSLYVQENYARARPRAARNSVQLLRAMALAADSLAVGDTVEQLIRRETRWELLPLQSYLSSVIPGEHCKGVFSGRPMFPRWLGMNSSTSANSRTLQELQQRTHKTTCCNKRELGSDYLPYLLPRLTTPLVSKKSEGIPEVMDLMDVYELKKDDWDTLQKFGQFSNRPDKSAEIPTKVKSSFTRAWNKRGASSDKANN